ncbi:MAG: endonuclease V [Actinomycetota bacterium]
MGTWPVSADELIDAQRALAAMTPQPWQPEGPVTIIGACFVCFGRGISGRGRRGEPAWGAAALARNRKTFATASVTGRAAGGYEPGLLALRAGELLESAVRALPELPSVLLVDATGRDHPRRAGLASHLGWILGIPTVGVTHRPLAASGEWPADERGARSPLLLDHEVVGYWVRTRPGARPLAVHGAWRTEPEVAADLVMKTVRRARTPDPLRRARRTARLARAGLLR